MLFKGKETKKNVDKYFVKTNRWLDSLELIDTLLFK